MLIHLPTAFLGLTCLCITAIFASTIFATVLIWRLSRNFGDGLSSAPVTVLRPLRGARPRPYDRLRSFCAQRYPSFQTVFGIRDQAGPA